MVIARWPYNRIWRVQYIGDERKYQGRPHDSKALMNNTFSEIQFRTYWWLRSTMRRSAVVYFTGNRQQVAEGEWVIRYLPLGLSHHMHKPAKPGELRWFTTLDGKDTK